MLTSVKDKNSEIVAKRWAHALMELAYENENIPKAQILKELRSVAEAINSSEVLIEVFSNPAISTEEKQIVICKLFQDKIIPIVYNFIYVLNIRKRANLLAEIADEFEKELDEINNVKHVKITSAIELKDEKKEEIKNKITEKLNKELVIDWVTDDSIIAGLIFDIDETVVDTSVRQKLNELSKSICK